MRALRLGVAIVVAMATTAHADTRVHSYAYVTGLTTDYATSADEGVRENRCNVTARLPRGVIKDRPANDNHSLLSGSSLVGERVKDPHRNCDQYLHTWQPVDFDPAKPDDVHFTWPYGSVDVGVGLIGGIVVSLGVFALVVEPLRYRWRIRRRPDRRYRDYR